MLSWKNAPGFPNFFFKFFRFKGRFFQFSETVLGENFFASGWLANESWRRRRRLKKFGARWVRAAYDSAPHNLRTPIYHLESYAQVQRQISNEFSFIHFYQAYILKDYSEISIVSIWNTEYKKPFWWEISSQLLELFLIFVILLSSATQWLRIVKMTSKMSSLGSITPNTNVKSDYFLTF